MFDDYAVCMWVMYEVVFLLEAFQKDSLIPRPNDVTIIAVNTGQLPGKCPHTKMPVFELPHNIQTIKAIIFFCVVTICYAITPTV